MAAKTVTSIPKFGWPGAFSSDTERQAWVDEVLPYFESNGFIRTSDTGQFSTTGVTVTTFNGGYEIRRFDGALQTSAPVFVKFTYSSSKLRIEVGTGSNGSGAITGRFADRDLYFGNGNFATGEIAISVIDDEYVGFCQYQPYTSGFYKPFDNFFFIGRSVDSNGDADATAVMCLIGPEYSDGDVSYNSTYKGPSMHAWDYVSSQSYTDGTGNFMYPIFTATSPKPLDAILMYRMWCNWAAPQPFVHAIGAHVGEWTRGGTVSIDNVGTTNHTYRCVVMNNLMYGTNLGARKASHSQACILMRYE